MKNIRIHPKALKEFRELPSGTKKKVKDALQAIAEGSERSLDIAKTRGKKGKEDMMRLRVGDHRIIFKIDRRTLWIIRIAHRSKVYKDL